MIDKDDIPLLTDLIDSSPEITLSDLGLDDDPAIAADPNLLAEEIAYDVQDAATIVSAASDASPVEYQPGAVEDASNEGGLSERNPGEISPALEQTLRRILDEHMELAWQEIRLAIQQHLDRS